MFIYILIVTENNIPYILAKGSMQDCITAGTNALETVYKDWTEQEDFSLFEHCHHVAFEEHNLSLYIRGLPY